MDNLDLRIKKLRESKGLSQQAVADKIGVSRVAVTKWESGETANLKLGNLLALCQLFGLTVDELLKGETNQESTKNTGIITTVQGGRATGKWEAYLNSSSDTQAAIDLLLEPAVTRITMEPEAQSAIVFIEAVAKKGRGLNKSPTRAA